MTLTELRCLLAIADAELNISAAAQRVHATQPSLSRNLKQLEDELGFQLFTRHGRALVDITPAGRDVIGMARRIVGEAASLRAYAANERGETSGDLTLATAQTYARHVLPPLLGQLVKQYPRLNIRLQGLGEGEPFERLLHNEVDIALVSTAGNRVPDGIALPLFTWQRVVVAERTHALAQLGRGPTLAELAACSLVTYDASRRPESTLRRALAHAGLEARFACSAQDADLIKIYVRAGLGVGLIADLAIEPHDREEFAVLPADPALPACIAWALLPAGRVVRDYTLDFIHLLAPQIDTCDIRRVLAGDAAPAWPEPPEWTGARVPVT
ncbi:MAG: LysR substrate-binding domain-containing protein [Lysobacter sp.]